MKIWSFRSIRTIVHLSRHPTCTMVFICFYNVCRAATLLTLEFRALKLSRPCFFPRVLWGHV